MAEFHQLTNIALYEQFVDVTDTIARNMTDSMKQKIPDWIKKLDNEQGNLHLLIIDQFVVHNTYCCIQHTF